MYIYVYKYPSSSSRPLRTAACYEDDPYACMITLLWYTCIYIYIYLYKYPYLYLSTSIHSYTCMYIYTYLYTHTYIYVS